MVKLPKLHGVGGDIMKSAMFKSVKSEWETPQWLFDQFNKEFHFNLDVCALPENAKCAKFYTPEQDGLSQKWDGICWCNPPYGRNVGKWIKKASETAKSGATVVLLIPSRTETAWWHDYIIDKEIRFLRGRLKFGESKHNAPFPSAIVIMRPAEVKR